MSKFKVGDKVKCISSISANSGGPKVGQEFIITSIEDRDSKNYYIGFKLNSYKAKPDIQSGKVPNWGSSCFKLIPATKHYKWHVQVTFITNMDISMLHISETDHHVSEDKIEDYIEFLVKKHKSDGIVEKRYNKIENKFVEE